MPDGDWWEALWADPARVLIECGLAAGMAAVNLCAGDGWCTLPMARIARRRATFRACSCGGILPIGHALDAVGKGTEAWNASRAGCCMTRCA